MPTVITVSLHHIETLDLSPVQTIVENWLSSDTLLNHEQEIQFKVDYPSEEAIELPEIPEVRLWFIRLDSIYPWLPYCLDWRSGELTRYAAMMVPHEFSPREGIQYNPQALDLFVMHKVFTIHHWLKQQGTDRSKTLMQMAELFGYELEGPLFDLLNQYPA
jgi:hypothetical protein